LFPATGSFAIFYRTFSTPRQRNIANNTTVLFVIRINWTNPTETYHTLKVWLQSDNSQSEFTRKIDTLFCAQLGGKEEECNEALQFPGSYYCNSHTNSSKNYKKSYLYKTKHYL